MISAVGRGEPVFTESHLESPHDLKHRPAISRQGLPQGRPNPKASNGRKHGAKMYYESIAHQRNTELDRELAQSIRTRTPMYDRPSRQRTAFGRLGHL